MTRVVALMIAGLVLLTGCASPTVAQSTGKPTLDTANAGPLVPQGVTDVLSDAKQRVRNSLAGRTGFTPPDKGPVVQHRDGAIAFVASDLTNGGVNTVSTGVRQAATAMGWHVTVLDGKGDAQGRAAALSQAIALRPIGIVLGGFDATEQAATIKQAVAQGIPVVGWHAGAQPGPIPETGLFDNVTTDPLDVAWLAAAYAIDSSGGHAGVAVFTDSQYAIAVRKAEAMRDYVKLCRGCAILSYEDSPIADADSRMPGEISSLLQRFGVDLTYLLGVNGNYFGGAKSALRDAGHKGDAAPHPIAAGDGDAAEFQRIRAGDYQAATVAEPILLQGWQLLDELNRALAGGQPSGFVAAPALITRDNVPSGGVFDPPSSYRDIYRKVWNKQ